MFVIRWVLVGVLLWFPSRRFLASLPVYSVLDPVLQQKNGVVTGAVETDAVPALLECAAGSTAGVKKDITALLEGRKSDLSRMHGVAVAAATAGESEELTALLEDQRV